jgi:hypothetical protein
MFRILALISTAKPSGEIRSYRNFAPFVRQRSERKAAGATPENPGWPHFSPL